MKLRWRKLFTYWDAAAVFIAAFGVYFLSAARTITGHADSDELITIGNLLGVPHPPGYPLAMILIKLFSFLPFGSVAFRAHLVSAVLMSLTLGLIYFLGKGLVRSTFKEAAAAGNGKLVLMLSALLFGFSGLYWLYASVFEVFSLHVFLIVLAIGLGAWWRRLVLKSSDFHFKVLGLWWLAVGLGLANQQTFLLFLPGFGVLAFLTLKKAGLLKSGWWKSLLGLVIFIGVGFCAWLQISCRF